MNQLVKAAEFALETLEEVRQTKKTREAITNLRRVLADESPRCSYCAMSHKEKMQNFLQVIQDAEAAQRFNTAAKEWSERRNAASK